MPAMDGRATTPTPMAGSFQGCLDEAPREAPEGPREHHGRCWLSPALGAPRPAAGRAHGRVWSRPPRGAGPPPRRRGRDESSDAGDVDPAVEKTHEKKRNRTKTTGDPGGVEEEDDALRLGARKTAEEDSAEDVRRRRRIPRRNQRRRIFSPRDPSPPPGGGDDPEYADDAESDVARAGRQDSREGVTPSWREAASTADARRGSGGSDDAVRLEVTVGNPESGESEFERAVRSRSAGARCSSSGSLCTPHLETRSRETQTPSRWESAPTVGTRTGTKTLTKTGPDEEGWDELDEEAAAAEATDDRGKKRRAREASRLSRIR